MSDQPKKTILVVDEAATVDTRDLVRLHEHVDQAEGKLVLIGDYDQLQAIGADSSVQWVPSSRSRTPS